MLNTLIYVKYIGRFQIVSKTEIQKNRGHAIYFPFVIYWILNVIQ